MSATLGVNLRVTCHGSRGDRKYMEDYFVLNYEPSEDEHKLEFAFFGIFDGHGGKEAARFAKDRLMNFIVSDKRFWSDEDDDVCQAITSGYLQTHHAMWQDQVNWPKTSSGLPSTSGTTASIAFIRRGKIYIGHVGDSSIVLGYQNKGSSEWSGKALTKDHKPEDAYEVARIESSGGKVVAKSGVPRVVWNRPRLGHKGPVRRSTPIDEIPFLAVARSLGDLWSYNSDKDQFIVSPHPDVHVIDIDVESHRCLIFGTDGLWNMLNPEDGVLIVQAAEQHNEKNVYFSGQPATARNQMWVNPSKSLVDRALRRWATFGARADNTSAVTLLFDPPGVQRRGERASAPQTNVDPVHNTAPVPESAKDWSSSMTPPYAPLEDHRVAIFTRPSTVDAVPSANQPASTDSTILSSSPSLPATVKTDPSSVKPEVVATAFPQLSEPTEDVLKGESVDSHACKTNQSPLKNTIPKDSSLAKDEKQPCASDNPPSAENVKSDLDGVSKTVESHLLKKALSSLKPAGDDTATCKDGHPFRKDVTMNCGSSSKDQEVPRPQAPEQQAVESPQRHSHKRMRGKTVTGGELSHSSPASSSLKANLAGDMGIVRRRHSSVLDSRTSSLPAGLVAQSVGYTPSYPYLLAAKRRTRSEDKLLQAVGRLEDDLRTSDEENKRIGWSMNWVNRLRPSDGGSEENNAHSCSTRRKKKWIRCSGNAIGRVKQARPSVSIRSTSYANGCDAVITRNCSNNADLNSSRVLRSDTHSSMPVHTLRSQNVDLKASRLSIHPPSKFTPKRAVQLKAALEMTSFAAGSSSLLPATKILLTSSGPAKRLRQSFCGRARPVTTRSRVKRLSK
ncbi:protein phosphatase 1D [Thrips palmi]|uniref:Protein phosphatase 1D n=1 Tax=Thrips palmi TaxID=161013 RepID=A0A6P8Y2H6_THRPL|nr:protein phosphatase 1D [Thrips palmi]